MPDRNLPEPGGPLRRISPAAVVIAFALVMTACVLGVVVWKALEAKKTDAGARPDRHPEPRALAGRACLPYHPIGRYRDGRNGRLAEVSGSDCRSGSTDTWRRRSTRCRRLREIGVLDADGNWRYSSLPETPRHNNSDRSYFTYHRDTPGSALRINEPLQSRLTGRSTIILSKRIDKQDGSFGGVLTAAIDSDYFNQLLPDVPARPRRQHQPDTERRRRPDPLAGVGQEHGSFQDRAVLKAPEAEFGRILQDHLPLRRHREVFRL